MTALVELTSHSLENPHRRKLLAGSIALIGMSALPGFAQAALRKPVIGFKPVAMSTADRVIVPQGYRVDVLYAWGDPVSDGPAFRPDATNTADDQALQAGMHHDGMHFFPAMEHGRESSTRGLMCINHEYTDEGLLHADGTANWSAEKVAKSQNAWGVSVIEIAAAKSGRSDVTWNLVRPSSYARRITAQTPVRISGPAAGNAAMQTSYNTGGTEVLGTAANCAHGATPWQTYLTCEENFNGIFKGLAEPTPAQKRYGIDARSTRYRWHEHDARFDVAKEPNEANRFGWVVEIDPWHPEKKPVKRTALGRFKHESATVTPARNGHIVVYMGDDEAFEHIYKFVSAEAYDPKKPDADLLDKGTLYVARFNDDGRGEWIALVHGQNGLTADNGFADQADVLIRARMAATQVGATRMDRPEWIAVHPHNGGVYCSLTNNAKRAPGDVDAANPRGPNPFGHVMHWNERNDDATATAFDWKIFLFAGEAQEAPYQDVFACPDGLWFDHDGRLWVETDVSAKELNKGEYIPAGNNQMLVADVSTGATKRFLTGPAGCELTGATQTPDGKTLFVNIQHPGEPASESTDPAKPTAVSSWPGNQFANLPQGRPRSATLAIRRIDGGVVGT